MLDNNLPNKTSVAYTIQVYLYLTSLYVIIPGIRRSLVTA